MKNSPKILFPVLIAGIAVLLAILIFTRGGDKNENLETHEHGEHEDSHEGEEAGHLALSDSVLAESGVTLDTVRMMRLAVRLPLQGKIVLNEDRAAHIHPRFPGVILEVRKQLGAKVRKGEVLAVIESNESLQPYQVVSRMDGTVVGRHAAVGETVTGDDELFTVADLSTVWVDFQVYRQDFNRLRAGQTVRLIAEGLPTAEVRLAYLSASTETHSQSLLARAELRNAGAWTPGLFVRGEAAVEEFSAPAVRKDAVQDLEVGPVVFVREDAGAYQAQPVKLGRRDGGWVEVLEGVRPGAVYVSGNSFLLKAELGKGEASHDH
jgi:cobalt-zinc-cadmium efflux system membrane fusion protein